MMAWRRPSDRPLSDHWRIYASLGLNEGVAAHRHWGRVYNVSSQPSTHFTTWIISIFLLLIPLSLTRKQFISQSILQAFREHTNCFYVDQLQFWFIRIHAYFTLHSEFVVRMIRIHICPYIDRIMLCISYVFYLWMALSWEQWYFKNNNINNTYYVVQPLVGVTGEMTLQITQLPPFINTKHRLVSLSLKVIKYLLGKIRIPFYCTVSQYYCLWRCGKRSQSISNDGIGYIFRNIQASILEGSRQI